MTFCKIKIGHLNPHFLYLLAVKQSVNTLLTYYQPFKFFINTNLSIKIQNIIIIQLPCFSFCSVLAYLNFWGKYLASQFLTMSVCCLLLSRHGEGNCRIRAQNLSVSAQLAHFTLSTVYRFNIDYIHFNVSVKCYTFGFLMYTPEWRTNYSALWTVCKIICNTIWSQTSGSTSLIF